MTTTGLSRKETMQNMLLIATMVAMLGAVYGLRALDVQILLWSVAALPLVVIGLWMLFLWGNNRVMLPPTLKTIAEAVVGWGLVAVIPGALLLTALAALNFAGDQAELVRMEQQLSASWDKNSRLVRAVEMLTERIAQHGACRLPGWFPEPDDPCLLAPGNICDPPKIRFKRVQ